MNEPFIVMTCDALGSAYAGAPGAEPAGPVWNQLVKPGHVKTSKGEYVLDEQAALLTLLDWARDGEHERVVDFEHATEGKVTRDDTGKVISVEPIKAPASGWISRIEWRGMDPATGGIWGLTRWLPDARKLILSGEYRFISPVIHLDPDTRRVFHLDHAALTNNPAIKGMVPLAAKSAGGQPPEFQEDLRMKKTLEALGLPPEATDEAASAAVLAMKSDATQYAEICTGLGVGKDAAPATVLAMKASATAYAGVLAAAGLATDVDPDKAKVEIMAMKTVYAGTDDTARTIADLQTRLDARDKADAKSGAEQLVMKAMDAGKVTAAMKEGALAMALASPKAFEEFVAKAPVLVPVGKAPESPNGMGGSVRDHGTGVLAQMGVTPERAAKALGEGGR